MRKGRLALLIALLAAPALMAQPTTFSVVNAANYGGTIASDSLATIFGSGLAQVTASATLDANGQLPTVLASTSVEINGLPAPLLYVSPGQINLVIPGRLTEGTATVLIRSTISSLTKSGTALIRQTAPGVFTSDASGTGPGAMLNALTFTGPPFEVQTGNSGTDRRTRIAVYGTGFRHAGKVTALAQDTVGNRYPLTVEFAGEAPGFFGLDQVNLLLPPDLDGAGTVSLVLTANVSSGDIAANTVTFQMKLMDAALLRLLTLTFSSYQITAGQSTTLTVGLNGVARAGGFAVGLRSDNAAAQVPAQITIPEGNASAQVTVSTSELGAPPFVSITALAGGSSQDISLAIEPVNGPQLATLSMSSAQVVGGQSVTGTVTVTGNVPAGGVNVSIRSDNSSVTAPAPVNVPFGRNSADFPIATLPVTSPQMVTLTAVLGSRSTTAKLTVVPPLHLELSAIAVVGGNSVSGTVTLGSPAPVGGAIVTLQSSDPAVRVTPITIPAGQTTLDFTLTTSAVPSARTVTIAAFYAGASQTWVLTVNPLGAPTLASLMISPDHVSGGSNTRATVTLSGAAVAGGMRVDLVSSSPLTAAASPNFAVIPQGQSSAVLTITTTRFAAVVTFTATAGGVSKTATLTVQ